MEVRSNPIRDKSRVFALRIVKCCKMLMEQDKEFILSKQLIRSGTSIGANVIEALSASSRKDFIYKLTIALKEANESFYWISLIQESGYAKTAKKELGTVSIDAKELIALLTAIIKTSRASLSS